MKRKVFLLFVLVGLMIVEYSCQDDQIIGGDSSPMRVIGLHNIQFYNISYGVINHAPLTKSEQYDHLILSLGLKLEEIVHKNTMNYSAYAATAPRCKWNPKLDSIKVFRNNRDITNFFVIGDSPVADVIQEITSHDWCSIDLSPTEAAADNVSSYYTVKMYLGPEVYEVVSPLFKIKK